MEPFICRLYVACQRNEDTNVYATQIHYFAYREKQTTVWQKNYLMTYVRRHYGKSG